MKKKHVMFIMSSFGIGGAEFDVLNLSTALIEKGYKVTISSKGGVLENKLPAGVSLLHLNIASRNFFISSWNKLKILFYCFLHQVTILNPQSIKGISNSNPAHKLLRISMIATIHNLQNSQWLKKSVQLLSNVPDVILFVSESERQKFIKSGLPPEVSRVMYSGIDVERFSVDFDSVPKQTIGIISRLSEEKGVEYGIKAFIKIADQFPQTRLIIVGDGPEKKKLTELSRKYRMEKRIIFKGTRVDVPNLLSQIDFLVLPSISESLSLVAREAMAAGKPVISSNVGGMKELIKHEENGLLVPSGDSNALAKAMSMFLMDPDETRNYGKYARKLIEEEYSAIEWAKKMDNLYRKAGGERISYTSIKKNILYVTTRFPFPGTKGDKVRAYHQIKELSKRNNIFLLSLIEDLCDIQYITEMEKYCQAISTVYQSTKIAKFQRWTAHFSWIPSQIAWFFNREMKRILPKMILAHDIEILYCQLIRGAQYGVKITNTFKVVDFVDAFSLNLKRNLIKASFIRKPILCLRLIKIKFFEKKILRNFNQGIIISENDKQHLGDKKTLVSPNGVVQDIIPLPVNASQEKSIVFSGNLNYWPNEDAVKYLIVEILPLLPENVKLYLVGSNCSFCIEALASERVIITGKVQSIIESLRSATVAVCPMRLGAGLQNKVLEAMAAGIPVVATFVANSGIGAPLSCIKIADEPQEFAKAVIELLENPELRKKMRDQAIRFINKRFIWSHIIYKTEQRLWLELNKNIGEKACPASGTELDIIS